MRLPLVKKPAAGVAEKGVIDFTEIHDAGEKQFDAWIARMKKDGYRPVSLNVRTVKDEARYTAVAIKEKRKRGWEFSRIPAESDTLLGEMWDKKYAAVSLNFWFEKGKSWESYLWIEDAPRNDGIWMGTKGYIENRIAAASEREARPICRCALDTPAGTRYGVVLDDWGTLPWTEVLEQTLDEIKEWVEKQKAQGWRPDHLCVNGNGARTQFGAILIRDPNGPDWEASWSLTKEEYEKELVARKRQGFRPLTAVWHSDDAKVGRFSAIWIRYRKTLSPTPTAPRLSVSGLIPTKLVIDDEFTDPDESEFPSAGAGGPECHSDTIRAAPLDHAPPRQSPVIDSVVVG